MNRRLFVGKASGILAALGAAIGVKAKGDVVVDFSPGVVGGQSVIGGPHYAAGIDEGYGILIPERNPIVQEDGCTYGSFEFGKSSCGTSWRLKWVKTMPDGTKQQGMHLMAGSPDNIVKIESKRYYNQ